MRSRGFFIIFGLFFSSPDSPIEFPSSLLDAATLLQLGGGPPRDLEFILRIILSVLFLGLLILNLIEVLGTPSPLLLRRVKHVTRQFILDLLLEFLILGINTFFSVRRSKTCLEEKGKVKELFFSVHCSVDKRTEKSFLFSTRAGRGNKEPPPTVLPTVFRWEFFDFFSCYKIKKLTAGSTAPGCELP